MIWYEWVVGSCQFVAAWWSVDWTLHGRKQPEAVERRRVRFERQQQEIAAIIANRQRQQNNYCTSCNAMLWDSPPGKCRRCRSAELEGYKPSGVDDALNTWRDQIAVDTIKFEKERDAFKKERDAYYAARPPSGPGLLIRGNINRQTRWGLTSEPPAM